MLTGRRAAKPAVDVEAEAAVIVARAMALEAAPTNTPLDQVAARIAASEPMPGTMPSTDERPHYFQVTEQATLQRVWLVAGLVLCLLLIVFALLVARDAAALGR